MDTDICARDATWFGARISEKGVKCDEDRITAQNWLKESMVL
jgi:hypothetical protein